MQKKVYTYLHTHWDYEWYFSINESSIQFIYHLDDVINSLKSGVINSYVLDGQMSILEDYLQIFPDQEQVIKELVVTDKLIIGPWYTQTDEMIIDGESITRNLYYGIKAAQDLGKYMAIGYLVDSFGQSANMPKIYNGFGIKHSIFWRGVSDEIVKQREFNWQSGDAEVVVYNLKNGYFFGGEVWMQKRDIEAVEEIFLAKTKTDIILLPVGSDQRKVDYDYLKTIDFYNIHTKHELVYEDATPMMFMNKLEQMKSSLPTVNGEFLEAQDSKIHRSIYSSRYDHKYLNDKVERRLVNKLEPLMVYANFLGIDFKQELLKKIWKILLKSHAHDSACGCNTDKTNQIIKMRLQEADELSYATKDYLLRKLVESNSQVNENDIVIFPSNFHEYQKQIVIEITTKNQGFELFNNNQQLDFSVLTQKRVYGGSIRRLASEHDESLYYYVTKVMINCHFKPLTPQIIKLRATSKSLTVIDTEIGREIEDDFYHLRLENGQFQLFVKNEQLVIDNWLEVIDDGDDGDTYDYSQPIPNHVIHLDFSDAQVEVLKGQMFSKMLVTGKWKIPGDKVERTNSGKLVEIPYQLMISLHNEAQLDCKLNLENRALNHRMRIVFNSDIKSKDNFAATPFGEVRRPNISSLINTWRQLNYKEEPTAIYPMINYCGLSCGEREVLLMSKGIKEYQPVTNSKLALTLFRSVGYLGKPDLLRRPGIASGNQYKYIKTPDSQLQEAMCFKFSYYYGKKRSEKWRIKKVKAYANSPMYYQKQELNKFTNTLKYFEINRLNHDVSFKSLAKNLNLNCAYISSIMPIVAGEFIIRIINPTTYKVTETMEFNCDIEYSYVNMLGDEISDVISSSGLIRLKEISPEAIINVKIRIIKN